MSDTIRVGLSPCPNDTFIFHALLHGLTPVEGLAFEPVFADVEELNLMARREELEVTKISFHAFGHLRDRYELLSSGAALGRGCGPLLVCRPGDVDRPIESFASIAVPGFLTSATLLLRLHATGLPLEALRERRFDTILDEVARGVVDAGLIIHESRFTYRDHGLVARVDLGQWWEEVEGHPIPLGGILAHRKLGAATIARIDEGLRRSVLAARADPAPSREFIRAHAQELSEEVTRAHIELYVNDFSVDLGPEGRAAIDHLFARAESAGVF